MIDKWNYEYGPKIQMTKVNRLQILKSNVNPLLTNFHIKIQTLYPIWPSSNEKKLIFLSVKTEKLTENQPKDRLIIS